MDKETLLREVEAAAGEGSLMKSELDLAYERGTKRSSLSDGTDIVRRHIGISELLYLVGAAIVVAGIVLLVGQNWSYLGSAARILVTMGSGVVAYAMGVFLSRDRRFVIPAQAFYLISSLVLPVGALVVLKESGADIGSLDIQVMLSAIFLAFYLVSLALLGQALFFVFSVLAGTLLVYAGAFDVFRHLGLAFVRMPLYLTMAIGASYLLLGYWAASRRFAPLSGWLYAAGTIGLLAPAISLGGVWDALFAGLVFAVLFLSVYLRSRPVLVFSSLFLMGYILKVTGKYFSEGLGWPLSLVIAGLALIATGYLTVYLNRRYFRKA